MIGGADALFGGVNGRAMAMKTALKACMPASSPRRSMKDDVIDPRGISRRGVNAALGLGLAASLLPDAGLARTGEKSAMTHELKTVVDRGYLRIATEEAFATREQVDVFPAHGEGWHGRQRHGQPVGFLRTKPVRTGHADHGPAAGPWRAAHPPHGRDGHRQGNPCAHFARVQPLLDTQEARGIASRANDYLADAVQKHPDRYIGMTAVAPQDPEWSAQEIRRGANELGFKGVQINSHTQGHYLDEAQFDPIFRALADTGQPLYIHPATLPDNMMGGMIDAGLDGAVFGFAVETSYSICCGSSRRAFSIAIPICRSWRGMAAKRCLTGSSGPTTCIRQVSARTAMHA